MADLQKRSRSIFDGVIGNAIFYLIQYGGSSVTSAIAAYLAFVAGLPAYQIALIGIGAFFIVAVALYLLMKAVTRNGETQSPQLPVASPSLSQSGIVNAPHFEFNPTINIPISQSQTQEAHSRKILDQCIEMRGFTEKMVRVNHYSIKALAIPFRNTSNDTIRHLAAQIEFENVDTSRPLDVNYGFWIESRSERTSLESGTTQHIVLVGLDGDQNITLDNKRTDQRQGAFCDKTLLPDGVWRVRIVLVGQDFRQAYPPFRIKASQNVVPRLLVESTESQSRNAECIKVLSDFVEEGRVLLLQGTGMDSKWPKANDWATRAEAYIRESISEDSAAWFSLATTETWPGLAIDRRFVDWVHTRMQRLGELATEVRKR